MPALMAAIDRHGIPVEELLAVCDGADSDLEAREMETFGELGRYCGQVASSVGICCLHIWGYRSEDGRAEALAGDCGIALQLTNILRDVREDALAGRVYLPAEDRARFGVGIDQLRSGEMTQGLRALFAFEAARARRYYESAAALDGLIEAEGRPMFRAVVGVYAALLSAIEKRGYDVLSGRVSVPGWRKAWIALRSAFGWAGVGAGARGAAPLPSSAP
jgi:phytoene synthase